MTDSDNTKVLQNSTSIDHLLAVAYRNGASDLHLSCNTPPKFRIDGSLTSIGEFGLVTDEWLRNQIESIAPATTWESFTLHREADFSHAIAGMSRFRVNVSVQRGTIAAVFRTIPTEIKSIGELGAPDVLYDLVTQPRGLILVTGPTGSGKSTTLAAMIDEINKTRADHIVTIEDPIEFVYQNRMSLINQREVGTDTTSFAEALKRVLRQDPDVILVGELRDPETIATALTAAETGHLVFGTLHTQSAEKTIDRIIDSFEPSQQGQVRSQLSGTLRAVISQTLIKRKGGGRVAASEIMVNNNAVANNIREGNIAQIYNAIQTGRRDGMRTLDQHLADLYKQGLVHKESITPLMKDKNLISSLSAVGTTNEWGI